MCSYDMGGNENLKKNIFRSICKILIDQTYRQAVLCFSTALDVSRQSKNTSSHVEN